jgi:hypothetical protein
MLDAPVICTFLLPLDGKLHTITVVLHIGVPVIARMEVRPVQQHPEVEFVATWCDGEWHVFEGTICKDPRRYLLQGLNDGYLLAGPTERDWGLVKSVLEFLSQAPTVWRR